MENAELTLKTGDMELIVERDDPRWVHITIADWATSHSIMLLNDQVKMLEEFLGEISKV